MTPRGIRSTLPENPRDWHRRVWALSWPVILANLSIPLVGAVDTAVVGHLPDPAFIGGVAVGAVVLNFLYFSLNFLRMGTSGRVPLHRGFDVFSVTGSVQLQGARAKDWPSQFKRAQRRRCALPVAPAGSSPAAPLRRCSRLTWARHAGATAPCTDAAGEL